MPYSNSPTAYNQQLEEKIALTQAQLQTHFTGEIEVFPSEPKLYRMRAEFKAWHDADGVHYAMYEPGEYRKPYIIDRFPAGSPTIQRLMPDLIEQLNESEELKSKLFQIEFLTTTTGEAIVTLIYHRPLNEQWDLKAKQLQSNLRCNIIGRSRKQKRVIGKDYVVEEFTVDGLRYQYQQIESSFTQPNALICQAMLNWACQSLKHSKRDLLELYCGNGNFTLPLSKLFRKTLATEISKASIASAKFNCQLNQVQNIDFVRMSSEELTQALTGVRKFNRLKGLDLDLFDFECIFVDPPRAGLDAETRRLARRFPKILYVSCNPETLMRDLSDLTIDHKISKAALFDQFPFTAHRECGVLLEKI